MNKVSHHLEKLIHPKQDDVRVYPLPENPDWVKLGKQFRDDGLLLVGVKLPADLRQELDAL
ncbi:hypothetical protein VSS37_21610 [Candidatus Thiothrix sp. Deng01]|uniref:Uncharacterized protein n=1 Tax=Candidatus Thiothrix phosphatis TaxID=3112415 RepID=A0ABU6D4J8_9GAMM|nr:hypothetical protein [Candidatus Thiothrix sp. Deng01]MEB4593588.1 hypothetical protein [Candidatus Thiothrix sp. Deng01]